MDPVAIFLLTIAAIFLIGVLGEIVFEKTGVPDVVWLIAVGVLLGPVSGVVNLWVHLPAEGVPVERGLSMGNDHLAILLAFRLARAWRAQLNIVCCVEDERDQPRVASPGWKATSQSCARSVACRARPPAS
jgi:hypothetical protein